MNVNLQNAIDALQAGQKGQAITALRQAIQAEPRNPTAWVWLARALDDPQKQEDCLQRALQLDPNHSFALSTQAELRAARSAQRSSSLRSLSYEEIAGDNPFQTSNDSPENSPFSAMPSGPEGNTPAFILDDNDPFLEGEADLSIFQPQGSSSFTSTAPFDFSAPSPTGSSPFSADLFEESNPATSAFWQEPEPEPAAAPALWQAEPEPAAAPALWQEPEPEPAAAPALWQEPEPEPTRWKEPELIYTPPAMPWDEPEPEKAPAPAPAARPKPKAKPKTKTKAKAKPKAKAKAKPARSDRPAINPGEIILRILFILLVLFGIVLGVIILLNAIAP
jgi:hypothetical protein